ncbi:MAG: hypothetical protein A2Z14_04745 [Chloroflexi bacterium RBG_16_48_8]|nr:MAG: hypothetical protein A2Z14_04745 [Chloroflexi bacterium RBG_16_48_8]
MNQKLTAPLASVIATLIAVGRLATIVQTTSYGGTTLGGKSILQYLFFDAGTLEPNVSLHLIFATAVLWIIAFSFLWLILSLISKDPTPLAQTPPPTQQ